VDRTVRPLQTHRFRVYQLVKLNSEPGPKLRNFALSAGLETTQEVQP
jgi:hypothetical protein